MLGVSQGEAEGKIDSSFANVPAACVNHLPSRCLCYPICQSEESLLYFSMSCFQELLNATFWCLATVMGEFAAPLSAACREGAGGRI